MIGACAAPSGYGDFQPISSYRRSRVALQRRPSILDADPTVKAIGHVDDATTATSTLYKPRRTGANCRLYSGSKLGYGPASCSTARWSMPTDGALLTCRRRRDPAARFRVGRAVGRCISGSTFRCTGKCKRPNAAARKAAAAPHARAGRVVSVALTRFVRQVDPIDGWTSNAIEPLRACLDRARRYRVCAVP